MRVKTNTIRYLCFILIIILSATCKEAPNAISLNNNEIGAFFPLKIGNRWVYEEKTDEANSVVEKMILDTISNKNFSTLYAFSEDVQVYPPPVNRIVSGYYSVSNGTAFFCYGIKDTTNGQYSVKILEIDPLLKKPVTVGTEWTNINSADTSYYKITHIGPTTLEHFHFTNAVLVIRNMKNLWFSVTDSTWFVQDVGIVKRISTMTGDQNSKSSIELREYLLQ
jgi:hypothetical protein